MSRTHRKRSITEEESQVKYVNRMLGYLIRRSFHYEYYLTEAGQKAYDKAMKVWETEYYAWLHNEEKYIYLSDGSVRYKHPPEKPILFHFYRAHVVYEDIDFEKEVEEAIKKYKKFKRDGQFYDSGVSYSFKKHCAQELRRFNRELARKIIKDDDSWEQKPYPDTYLGKKHVWHYW